ncbi:E3 ubiquitin ligase BIG BROTHER-related like [Actinidia chinensis var. chinensis]|uniref:E3 ubiquitin ligase BIG BROTHER-related like n=1 Tax=Actinidia chinensis var. chinensis TaxID=1590841 RepID=A0A2R6RD26_ACTCC|nr:E3 ubiquitin ligase BIG BROTHER-related like [Actinidia chinensis var. chinensis]
MGDENQQQAKQPIPNELEQEQELVDSDFAFALALQEEERNNFTMLENDNDGEDYDDYDEDDEVEEEDIQEMEAELEFSEGEDDSNGNYEELMEEDDIDPDELSYEDLIALGEIVGDENTGLSLEQISSCLRPISADSKMVVDRCVICQAEYEEGGERATLVALPSCEHTYHSDCISSWLQIKKTCPICGTEVVTKSNSC